MIIVISKCYGLYMILVDIFKLVHIKAITIKVLCVVLMLEIYVYNNNFKDSSLEMLMKNAINV